MVIRKTLIEKPCTKQQEAIISLLSRYIRIVAAPVIGRCYLKKKHLNTSGTYKENPV